jgi:hypothetical protein
MFFCWLPSQFYNIVHATSSDSSLDILIGNILHVIPPLYGLLLSLIFYTKTDKARTEWINVFRKLKLIEKSNEVELRESSKTVESLDIPIDDGTVDNILVVRIFE